MRQLAFEPIQTTWGDLVTVKQGKYVAKSDLASSRSEDTPVPTVGANGVLGYVPKASYQRRVPLVTCRGSNCGLIQYPLEPVWVTNNAMALDAGTDEENSFIYYLALNTDFNDVVSGSAQPQITAGPLKSKAVSVPPREYWPGIAATLGALDDKIESNRQISRTVMSLAEAHFAKAIRHEQVSWVPFDEVVHRLNVVHKHNGKSVGSKGRTIVLDQSSEGVLGYHDGEPEFLSTPAAPICLFGDHTCTWRLGLGKFDVGPNVIPVVPKKESRVDPLWMYFGLKGAQQFQEYRRHWMEFRRHEVPWVDISTQLSFVDAVRPAIGMAHELTIQSTRLREIRDALLPELLSGRIRVADVELP